MNIELKDQQVENDDKKYILSSTNINQKLINWKIEKIDNDHVIDPYYIISIPNYFNDKIRCNIIHCHSNVVIDIHDSLSNVVEFLYLNNFIIKNTVYNNQNINIYFESKDLSIRIYISIFQGYMVEILPNPLDSAKSESLSGDIGMFSKPFGYDFYLFNSNQLIEFIKEKLNIEGRNKLVNI